MATKLFDIADAIVAKINVEHNVVAEVGSATILAYATVENFEAPKVVVVPGITELAPTTRESARYEASISVVMLSPITDEATDVRNLLGTLEDIARSFVGWTTRINGRTCQVASVRIAPFGEGAPLKERRQYVGALELSIYAEV